MESQDPPSSTYRNPLAKSDPLSLPGISSLRDSSPLLDVPPTYSMSPRGSDSGLKLMADLNPRSSSPLKVTLTSHKSESHLFEKASSPRKSPPVPRLPSLSNVLAEHSSAPLTYLVPITRSPSDRSGHQSPRSAPPGLPSLPNLTPATVQLPSRGSPREGEAELKRLELLVSELQSERTTHQKSESELRATLEEKTRLYNEALNAYKEELVEHGRDCALLQKTAAQVTTLETELRVLQAQNVSINLQLRKARKEHGSSGGEEASANANASEQVNSLTAELEREREHCGELQDRFTQQTADSEVRCTQLASEAATLRAEVSELERKLSSAQATVLDFTVRLQQTQGSEATESSRINFLEERAEQTSEMAALVHKNRVAELEGVREKLTKELAGSAARVAELTRELTTLQAQHTSVNVQLKKTREDLKKNLCDKEEMSALQTRVEGLGASLAQQKATAEAQIAELSAQLRPHISDAPAPFQPVSPPRSSSPQPALRIGEKSRALKGPTASKSQDESLPTKNANQGPTIAELEQQNAALETKLNKLAQEKQELYTKFLEERTQVIALKRNVVELEARVRSGPPPVAHSELKLNRRRTSLNVAPVVPATPTRRPVEVFNETTEDESLAQRVEAQEELIQQLNEELEAEREQNEGLESIIQLKDKHIETLKSGLEKIDAKAVEISVMRSSDAHLVSQTKTENEILRLALADAHAKADRLAADLAEAHRNLEAAQAQSRAQVALLGSRIEELNKARGGDRWRLWQAVGALVLVFALLLRVAFKCTFG